MSRKEAGCESSRYLQKPVHGGEAWKYPGVIDFSSNINPLGPSPAVLEAVLREIDAVGAYPSDGAELRGALADELGVSPENIVLGNGSSEIIKVVCEALLRRGVKVLIPQPTFAEYEYFSRLCGAAVLEAVPPPIGDDPIAPGLKGIGTLFLCNPNNPTGASIPPRRLEEILLEAGSAGCTVVVDEAYQQFSDSPSAAEMVESHPNLIIIRSMTKFYAIPGLRLGYAVAGRETARMLEARLPPWNVNSLAMAAGIAALRDREFARESVRYIARERERLFGELRRISRLEVYPTAANFFLINIKATGMSSREAKSELIKRGILVRDCSTFRHLGTEHIRICVRRREENLLLVDALEELSDG
ncbi:MAG: threonine-phosphate decarboxylase [Euryarchaeota archaeon]|nr:threonine-phosphate decarboxylase [Euryarchaeota archaeon]